MSIIPSFISEFFDKNKFVYSPDDIEDTSNGMWLKYNNISNPSAKNLSQLRAIALLGEVTKNAVSVDKQSFNFLLWSDVDSKWHFESVSSLIKKAKEENEPHRVFSIPDIPIQDKITEIVVQSSADNIQNLENKIFFSEYARIDPDYTNPYLDFTDTTSGTTSNIEKYEYFKSFPKIPHIYDNPLISELTFPKGAKTNQNPKKENIITNIPSIDFGYFDLNSNNTDTPVWWDYLGKINNRYNNISWQTQYDITNMPFEMFHTIHTKIRVPLMKNRMEFARLKNIKRQWETYRCVVCCMDQPIGSAADLSDFKKAAEDPSGFTFSVLFGKNGLFVNKPTNKDYVNIGSVDSSYKIVAAGSFTDQLNYIKQRVASTGDIADGVYVVSNASKLYQNGLTFSRDLSKSPYNQTIEEFYNLEPTSTDKYVSEIITKGVEKYTTKIADNIKRLAVIKIFTDKVNEYVTNSVKFIHDNVIACSQCNNQRSILSSLYDNNNYWSKMRHSDSGNLGEYSGSEPGTFKSESCGYDPFWGGPNIPIFQKNITDTDQTTLNRTNRGNTGSYHIVEGVGRINDFEIPQYNCLRTINFNYNWYSGATGAYQNPNKIISDYNDILSGLEEESTADSPSFPSSSHSVTYTEIPQWVKTLSKDVFMRGKDQEGPTAEYYNTQSTWGVKEKCIGDQCYNEYCFDPHLLIAFKEIAYRQRNSLLVENVILNKVKTTITTGLQAKWKDQYTEWSKRKAFFHSKKPGKSIFRGQVSDGYRGTTLSQPLSLDGIKSITRKDIRGSRYEILAKAKGITGASMGSWLYEVFFEDVDVRQSLSGTTANPYYDQKYKQGNNWFFTDRYTIRKKIIETKLKYYSNKHNSGLTTQYEFKDLLNSTEYYGISGDGIVVPADPPIEVGMDSPNYIYAFNIFKVTSNTKPANIKREEIASYIRIEFDSPIGLDRISDFPDGFIRNAGVEYFLPYLVSLTPGPTGRQTIRNNVAVIGMDPYGFDVAVKKMKISNTEDNKNYISTKGDGLEILQTKLSTNGMDLWPEAIFETRYPYYAADSRGIYSYTDSYNGYDIRNRKSAEVDPERKNTALGSGMLLSSHRKIKPHRSWWSFYMPHNIYIPQEIYSLLTTDLSNIFQHGHFNINEPFNGDFDTVLSFSPDQAMNSLFKTN